MKDDDGFDKGGSSGDKSSDTSYILNVQPTGFPDILQVECKRKNIQYNSKVVTQATGKMKFPNTQRG